MSKLTQERLKELLEYNQETGVFKRKTAAGGMRRGTVAGTLTHQGYIEIKLQRRTYSAHRLVWLYVHGHFPDAQIDHINRDRSDNRLCNLRAVTHSCNVRNSCIPSTNTSGIRGVHWHKAKEKWSVKIVNKGRQCHVGDFDDKVEAAAHRFAVEQCLGWIDCDKRSSAKDYLNSHINLND